jgi:hypothetical protein
MSNAYDPERCDAFEYNMDPPFTVEAHGTWKKTIDCSYCGGYIQNYQISLMTDKRAVPKATIKVFDQTGKQVGTGGGTGPKDNKFVNIGTVPADAIYTVVVTGGDKRERLIIYCSGGM